ncbi:unnamed protein product [Urochloa humidicola]
MSNNGATVAMKLFIDKEKQRVLFAESDKDFVDVLFSFLTLPLGTIVRLLGKQSGVGCLDEVYKSVEALSVEHFQTKACKAMLLSPLNAAASQCNQLKIRVDDTNPKKIGICLNPKCYISSYSSVPDAVCDCEISCCGWGLTFAEHTQIVHATVGYNGDGGFVKSGLKLIVTDDLQVAPASTSLVFSLLDKFGLNAGYNIEEKILELNSNKIISLLRRALISQQALTGLCFDVAITPDAVNLHQLPENLLQQPKQAEHRFNAIKIKLIQTKDDASVLYGEAGPDFIDLVFGLLSIPLGSMIKAYGQWSPHGCIDNLYRSIAGGGHMKRECQDLLLSPKLAPYFGCSISNVLQVKELDARMLQVKCSTCLRASRNYCPCKSPCATTLREMNPKPSSTFDTTNGAYIKGGQRNFIVANNLRILHFSLTNTLQVLRAAKITKEKLVEKEVTLDETQVLKLLRAAIFTGDALSSALLPHKKKRRPHH